MKSLLCVLFLLLLAELASYGQGFRIEYNVRFNDLYDRGRADRLHAGYLIIGNNVSRYYTVEKEKYEPRNDYDVMIMPDTANQVYTDIEKGMLLAQETDIRGKPFFVSDSLHPMIWTITSEEKKIDSLLCIKAECQFRGRTYIAWFSPAIPLPFGPWKMGGLPGLIIDLQDAEENLLIRMKSFSRQDSVAFAPQQPRFTKEEHVLQIRQMLKRMKESSRASSGGECITCQQQSVVQLYTWEKIPQ